MLSKSIFVEIFSLDIEFKERITNQTETKCKEESIGKQKYEEFNGACTGIYALVLE
jgi:hypothetical protein